MSRVTVILILFLAFTSCSAIKRSTETTIETETTGLKTFGEIYRLNLTSYNFNIIKATIEIITEGNKQIFLGSLKYRRPGNYLISIRSRAGIEGGRIFLTQDTILVNDRIHKKLFYGSADYLYGKYGISGEVLPMILGDISDQFAENQQIQCIGNEFVNEKNTNGKKITYKIDCSWKKLVSAIVKDTSETLEMRFKKFQNVDRKRYPGRIEIEDSNRETIIYIDIEKIEFNTEDNLNFVPGNGYERIPLK